MVKQRKIYEVTKEDGWWIASTPSVDRDRDTIDPLGINLANFQANPVMIWGHDYRNPYHVIGVANQMQASNEDFRVLPKWRNPVSESDPMTVIKHLIDEDIVRTLSVGFMPKTWEENDHGGFDFSEIDLLEISLVPIPSNQDAVRLEAKKFGFGLGNLGERLHRGDARSLFVQFTKMDIENDFDFTQETSTSESSSSPGNLRVVSLNEGEVSHQDPPESPGTLSDPDPNDAEHVWTALSNLMSQYKESLDRR